MRNRISLLIALPGIVALSLILLAQNGAQEQRGGRGGRGGRGNAAPSPPHDPHDLTGVWNLAGGTDLSLSRTPPALTPEGQKKFDANKPSYGRELEAPMLPRIPKNTSAGAEVSPLHWAMIHWPTAIRSVGRACFSWPARRNHSASGSSDSVLEWTHVWRTIWTDGRPLPKDPDSTWYGYSVGRWEGDTFVVETAGSTTETWIDHFGDVHSDEMHLTERWHRLDQDNMEVTMVLEDPKFYKQPWVSDKKMWRLQPKRELREEFCAPVDEQLFNQRTRNPAGGLNKK